MKLKTEIDNIYQSIDSLKIIRESARDFALQYIKPYVLDWDENQHFPKEVLIKAGEFGFCLLYTSPSPRDRNVSRMPSSA